MQAKLIHREAGQQTFVLVFDADDEAMAGLTRFAHEQALTAAQFSGIGAFSGCVLGYFDWETKDYAPIRVDEQVEVVSLIGDVALQDGEPAVHAHAVVAGCDGAARGGHLLEAHVRPTLEIVLSESPAHLHKRFDPNSGLAPIALDESDERIQPQGEASLPHVPDDSSLAGKQARHVIEHESETPRSATEEGGGLQAD
jgi:predicted DNA-binding protein with PD1-like motif